MSEPSTSSIEDSEGSEPIDAITTTEAAQRLLQSYAIHTDGQQPDGTLDTTFGDLHVSSDGEGYAEYLQQSPDDQEITLTDKTINDLQTLHEKGFEIHFDETERLGGGLAGQVFLGVFNEGISQLNADEGRHMVGVESGQPFAVKYLQFIPSASLLKRLNHEIEKLLMKTLDHSNIVSFKIAINLGKKHYLLNQITTQSEPIVSYDRMFLVMALAECSLEQYCDQNRLNDRYAIDFAQHMCAGMCYMHESGVAHNDAHIGNVLLFETPTGPVAKWIDFGESVWRQQYERWGVIIDDIEFTQLVRRDIQLLAKIIGYIAAKGANGADCVGYDLLDLEDLATDLNTTDKTFG